MPPRDGAWAPLEALESPLDPAQASPGTGLAYKPAVTFVSLVFLFVYLFGAYAYGAATVYGFRQVGPIWGGKSTVYPPGLRARMDQAGLALFAISTVWFVLHVLVEFRNFIGFTHESVVDLGTLMVYLFPPVIMHTVYLESQCADEPPPPALYKHLLHAMYVFSPMMHSSPILVSWRMWTLSHTAVPRPSVTFASISAVG